MSIGGNAFVTDNMSKGTTIKDALASWEKKHECKASEATEIKLYAQYPPIEKMDASLSTLANCEKLSLSTNCIEKIANLNGLRIGVLKKLKVLYMSNNQVKAWDEFQKLAELPVLEDLLFVGNPLEEKHSAEGNWRDEAIKRLPRLKKLDGVPVVRQDEEEEEEG
ncbi:Dynein axonemal light chain 1 [Acropora cervicornis]|uniref:Dynein axonemal light chain 1 n=1 Tax=Acropora cervicornis TaxID=6130 RepID=A0AAD9VAM7_ACRCE|nr:Dynein axonemal light chain 1 [Acropora cervicornis]